MHKNDEKGTLAQLNCTDRTIPFEFSAEFLLPDYRSEISRLLWVRSTVLPPEHFVSGRRVDFSGGLRFELLYVGPDGALYSVPLEEGYAFTFPQEGGEQAGASFSAEVCCDNLTCRVVAPRKLSLRARMHARVQCFCERSLAPQIKGESARQAQLCRRSTVQDYGRFLGRTKDALNLQESMELAEDLRLIGAHGDLFLRECTAVSGGVRMAGETCVTLLLCHEEGAQAPFVSERRIPFECTLPLEEAAAHCVARGGGSVTEIIPTPEEGKLKLELGLTLWAEAMGEECVVLCRDVFLPGALAECHHTEHKLLGMGPCNTRNLSLFSKRPLQELGLRPEDEIITAFATPEIREKTADGARTILSGEIVCQLLYRRDGELGASSASFPLRTVLEEHCTELLVDCSIPVCRVSKVRDELHLEAELQLAIRGYTPVCVQTLSEAVLSPAADTLARRGIELYFPTGEESLWEVAKRYATAPEALVEANGLVCEDPGERTLGDVRFLLIP